VEPARRDYRRDLQARIPVPSMLGELSVRAPDRADDVALARLMEAAYAGTIDEDLGDNDDADVEIANWHRFGADATVSRVAVDADGRIVGAALITVWDGRAYLAYVMTQPDRKGQGVAATVVAAALRALARRGEHSVEATVTVGNVPSERLLSRLGFV
jgi:RimJ/RimL family protein N-acetyltransferase